MGTIGKDFPDMWIVGIILLFVGALLFRKLKSRRFKRTAATGLERFSGWTEGFLTRLLEGLLMLLAWFLILGGVVLILGRML